MTDVAMIGKPRYERVENDFYATPAWVTEVLLRHVRLGDVWEPACGQGAMVDVLAKAGLTVCVSDIDATGDDFLSEWRLTTYDIITNPPYNLAEEFVRHALALTKPNRRKVAMVLRHEWDCAAGRQDLFDRPPFAMKIVLTRRPQWIPGELKASPRHNFAIFVWDWMHVGPATLRYDR